MLPYPPLKTFCFQRFPPTAEFQLNEHIATMQWQQAVLPHLGFAAPWKACGKLRSCTTFSSSSSPVHMPSLEFFWHWWALIMGSLQQEQSLSKHPGQPGAFPAGDMLWGLWLGDASFSEALTPAVLTRSVWGDLEQSLSPHDCSHAYATTCWNFRVTLCCNWSTRWPVSSLVSHSVSQVELHQLLVWAFLHENRFSLQYSQVWQRAKYFHFPQQTACPHVMTVFHLQELPFWYHKPPEVKM